MFKTSHIISHLMKLVVLACLSLLPDRAVAHFSYADPRIVHIAETEDGEMVILIRMPAPLALLPADWQGAEDRRIPPFARRVDHEIYLDREALIAQEAAFHKTLRDGLSISLDGHRVVPVISRTTVWPDADRPIFSTVKSALKTMDQSPPNSALPYFDVTLDIEILIPGSSLTQTIALTSDLGHNFHVIEQFGTVVKLHRDGGTETRAMMGVLDVSFDSVQSPLDRLITVAWIGAGHIYLGLDHLAMIMLIAIAATGWRQALMWASAFTVGHVLTLAAGLYGYAPQAGWFIPAIELLIVLSIVVAGIGVVLKRSHVLNWPVLFTIGLIHGYGFASAASVALFSGEVNAMVLLAFTVGLELCQLAVYLLILPVICGLDRALSDDGFTWRRPVAFFLAAAAGLSVVQQIAQVSGLSIT